MNETALRPGDLVAERFRVKEVLGVGPFGVVLRVLDTRADAEVALKLFHGRFTSAPEDLARLELTLEKVARISHPHIARVLETGRHRSQHFVVRQFVDGMSLRHAMERRRAKRQPFALEEVEALVTQLAAALDTVHRTMAHGDLKPENVIVQPRWIKVTDAGLGSALARAAFVDAYRDRNQLALLAPEYQATTPLDGRTDTYALGVLVGELLCGVLPGAHVPSLTRLRPGLPGALEGLYRKALNEDPDARYQSALELAAELSAVTQRHAQRRGAAATTAPGAPATRRPPPEVPARPTGERREAPSLPAAGGDETQQLDAELVAQAIAAKVAASAGSDVPPPATPSAGAVAGPSRRGDTGATQPLGVADVPGSTADQSPTVAMPSIPAEFLASPRRGPPVATRRSRGTLWLVLLTLVGLAGGTLGGSILLRRLRRRPAVVAPPAPAPPASAPAQTSPAAPAPAGTPSPQGTNTPGASPTKPASPRGSPPAAPAAAASCPDGMVLVKAGGFQMGTAADDPMMGFDERALVLRGRPVARREPLDRTFAAWHEGATDFDAGVARDSPVQQGRDDEAVDARGAPAAVARRGARGAGGHGQGGHRPAAGAGRLPRPGR